MLVQTILLLQYCMLMLIQRYSDSESDSESDSDSVEQIQIYSSCSALPVVVSYCSVQYRYLFIYLSTVCIHSSIPYHTIPYRSPFPRLFVILVRFFLRTYFIMSCHFILKKTVSFLSGKKKGSNVVNHVYLFFDNNLTC
jgi:hypothetical protein